MLSEVGVALACIGVALFEVGVTRATPKVYKPPTLIKVLSVSQYCRVGQIVVCEIFFGEKMAKCFCLWV